MEARSFMETKIQKAKEATITRNQLERRR